MAVRILVSTNPANFLDPKEIDPAKYNKQYELLYVDKNEKQRETRSRFATKINRGDVSHTVAPGSRVLTTRDQVFTGEVNSLDYNFVLKKSNLIVKNCEEIKSVRHQWQRCNIWILFHRQRSH